MSGPVGISRFKVAGAALLLAAVGALTALVLAQRASHRREAAARRAELEAGPRVRVAQATGSEGPRVISLEGEALPYASTTLFAKVSGFLREIRVDKGSPVRKGQLLAVLDVPESERDLKGLLADAEDKRHAAQRMAQLGRQGIVSPQQVEDSETLARVAEEKAASQRTVMAYRRVVAPFDGVVTQRFADPGAMVQNGGNLSSAQPILSLAQVGRLRVSFYLDQQIAPLVKAGFPLEVSALQNPGLTRATKVARLAGALDPRTRTLLVEADLDNRDGAFLAGGYVSIRIRIPQRGPQVFLPSEAVAQRGAQSFAALLGPDGRAHFQALVLGEEAGGKLRVASGLKGGETVILHPGPLQEGDRVRVQR